MFFSRIALDIYY